MNTAISRFLSTLKQPYLGVLVALILTGATLPVLAQNAPSSTGSVLQPNDQGESVSDLQQRLSSLGYYSGPVTGYFDTSTQEAVSRFQQENGLTPDGIVGAATGGMLYPGGANPATAAVDGVTPSGAVLNDGGTSVTELQQQLVQLGYYTGAVTGVFDQQTQSAVMTFQRDRGLSADGIVGSATQAALSQTPQQASPESATGTAYTPSATPDGLLQLGSVGAEVSTLQTQLQALGYYDGPISGSFGSQTQAALIAFQQAQGLTADGIAGPRVSTALSTPSQTAAVAPATVTPATVAPATVTPAAVTTATTTAPVSPSTMATGTTTPASVQPQINPSTPGIVQVPPVAPAAVMPPPSPQTQPVALQPGATRPPAMRSAEGRFGVMELQRRLQLRGFDLGDMNGVYDASTQDAIIQAQQSYGLDPRDLAE